MSYPPNEIVTCNTRIFLFSVFVGSNHFKFSLYCYLSFVIAHKSVFKSIKQLVVEPSKSKLKDICEGRLVNGTAGEDVRYVQF